MAVRIFVSLGLLLASAAWGEGLRNISVECPSPEQVATRITACTENREAVDRAQECYRAVIRAWQGATADLNRVMAYQKMGKHTSQENSLERAQADYQNSMAKLQQLIDMTDRNTERVAGYTFGMHEDPNQPLACFTEAYAAVENVVNALDDKLTEGVNALEAAKALNMASAKNDAAIDSVPANGPSNINKKSLGKSAAGGSEKVIQSDVTGPSKKAPR